TGQSSDNRNYTVENPLRFPGQYNDYNYRSLIITDGVGPYYNWNRWYNPQVGRYLQLDPLVAREALSMSLCQLPTQGRQAEVAAYSYADNAPIACIDKRGLSCTYDSMGFPRDVLPAALRKLDMLSSAPKLDDLRSPPGNHLEALRGDLKGRHSIRANDQWRVVFRWEGNDAHDVTLVDYH
ncbi:MAG: type II toxin-antitoxin system RelE/ParE family toxin, partial [Deltaproteobacteria bacterium]|nr:type II toxin-antitoxin system RelE/ParE family toxin [Deltaproteobacteria bacterium]